MQDQDVMFFKTWTTYMAFEGETLAETVDRTHCVTDRDGIPKGCNGGNGYDCVQE
jgi:hypothetical protein